MENRKKIYIKDNMCTIYKLIFHKIQNILMKNGYEIVDNPFESDVCLAGVCAAFNADEERSIAILANMQKAGKPIYVYGCMTQVNPAKINSYLQFSSWRADYLVQTLTNGKLTYWYEEKLPNDFRTISDYRVYDPKKKFIGITVGCAFTCSYCPHKKGTGNIVSISETEIIGQIERLNHEAIDTIILTGTDTACYGIDIGGSFYRLLRNVLQVLNKSINIHIAQFNPEGLFIHKNQTNLILDLFSDKRIKDIQLPIQTASQRLLKLMNRNYSLNELEEWIISLKANSDVMLRTDLMTGFPTETLHELDESIEYACRNFSEIAVYAFELKGGTPIANMNVPLMNQEEIERRRQYAIDEIKSAGLLAHSGGQKIETLITNDRLKETLQR